MPSPKRPATAAATAEESKIAAIIRRLEAATGGLHITVRQHSAILTVIDAYDTRRQVQALHAEGPTLEDATRQLLENHAAAAKSAANLIP